MSDPSGEPKAELQISREEVLEVHLLHQKLVTALLEERVATMNLQEAQNKRVQATAKLNEQRMKLAKKYSIDFATHEITEDGRVQPRAAQQVLQQQLLELATQKG